jgi:hypothetical protein
VAVFGSPLAVWIRLKVRSCKMPERYLCRDVCLVAKSTFVWDPYKSESVFIPLDDIKLVDQQITVCARCKSRINKIIHGTPSAFNRCKFNTDYLKKMRKDFHR